MFSYSSSGSSLIRLPHKESRCPEIICGASRQTQRAETDSKPRAQSEKTNPLLGCKAGTKGHFTCKVLGVRL